MWSNLANITVPALWRARRSAHAPSANHHGSSWHLLLSRNLFVHLDGLPARERAAPWTPRKRLVFQKRPFKFATLRQVDARFLNICSSSHISSP